MTNDTSLHNTSHPKCSRRFVSVIMKNNGYGIIGIVGYEVRAARSAWRDKKLSVLTMLSTEHGHTEQVLDAIVEADAMPLQGNRCEFNETEPSAPSLDQRAVTNACRWRFDECKLLLAHLPSGWWRGAISGGRGNVAGAEIACSPIPTIGVIGPSNPNPRI
jgi:hypothetical protein